MVVSNYRDGKIDGKIEVAKEMKADGIDSKKIQKYTGLSAEEVEKA